MIKDIADALDVTPEVWDDNPELLPERTTTGAAIRMLRLQFKAVTKGEILPDHAEWNDIQREFVKAAAVLKEGERREIDDRYLRRYASDFILKQSRSGNYGVIVSFMKNTGYGTEAQIAHFNLLDRQQKEAIANEKEALLGMDTADRPMIEIPQDATMAEFFWQLERSSSAQQEILLGQLFDFLGTAQHDFDELRYDTTGSAAAISFADFFDGRIEPEDWEKRVAIRQVARRR